MCRLVGTLGGEGARTAPGSGRTSQRREPAQNSSWWEGPDQIRGCENREFKQEVEE